MPFRLPKRLWQGLKGSDMSGLNFLLWTIAAILILVVVAIIMGCIFAYHKRNQAIKEFGKEPTFIDRLKKAQAEQEELLKQHNKR